MHNAGGVKTGIHECLSPMVIRQLKLEVGIENGINNYINSMYVGKLRQVWWIYNELID